MIENTPIGSPSVREHSRESFGPIKDFIKTFRWLLLASALAIPNVANGEHIPTDKTCSINGSNPTMCKPHVHRPNKDITDTQEEYRCRASRMVMLMAALGGISAKGKGKDGDITFLKGLSRESCNN